MKSPLQRLNDLGIAASSSKLGGIFYHVVCRRIDSVLIPLSGGRLALGPPGALAPIFAAARPGKVSPGEGVGPDHIEIENRFQYPEREKAPGASGLTRAQSAARSSGAGQSSPRRAASVPPSTNTIEPQKKLASGESR